MLNVRVAAEPDMGPRIGAPVSDQDREREVGGRGRDPVRKRLLASYPLGDDLALVADVRLGTAALR